MIIYLGRLLPDASSDLPKAWRAAFITLLFGLASDGVYMCPPRYRGGGSLLHCLSTLTRLSASERLAVYFCCTGLGVTSTGRYPASCPMKPGLSSPAAFQQLQPRSSASLNIIQFTLYFLFYKHGITKGEEPVSVFHSLPVSCHNIIFSSQS